MTKFAQTWRVLHEALRQSLHPQNIVFALVGTLAMVGLWRLAGTLLLPGPEQLTSQQARPAELRVHEHHKLLSSLTQPLPLSNLNPEASTARSTLAFSRAPLTPVAAYLRLADPVRRLFFTGHTRATFIYYLFGGIGSILIWAYAGLPITRRTILQIGQEETLGFQDAISFGRKHGYTAFSAVVIPLIGIAMMAIPIFVLGLFMRWDVGVFVVALLFVGVTLVSSFMAVLALGLFLGWPLMWGAVSADDVDGFEAISRSYAYGVQRPLNYASYLLLGLALGMLGWMGVWLVAEMVLALNYWCVEVGCGSARLAEVLQQTKLVANSVNDDVLSSALMQNAGFLIRWVESFVRGAASSVSFSLFFSMAGAIYLLLRRDVDETELDQIASVPARNASE